MKIVRYWATRYTNVNEIDIIAGCVCGGGGGDVVGGARLVIGELLDQVKVLFFMAELVKATNLFKERL